MITTYRILGLILLFASGSGFCNLLARYRPEFRTPMFWLALLAAGVLAGLGTMFYYSKETDEQWSWKLAILIAVGLCLLVGGLIQWT